MAAGAKRSARKASAKRTARRNPAAPTPAVSPLFGFSSDWYWEQGADLKFTRVEVRNDAAAEQALAKRILGKRRWETGVEIEDGWDAHRAMLEARAPFRDVLMWRNLPDGARRYISVSGEPVCSIDLLIRKRRPPAPRAERVSYGPRWAPDAKDKS